MPPELLLAELHSRAARQDAAELGELDLTQETRNRPEHIASLPCSRPQWPYYFRIGDQLSIFGIAVICEMENLEAALERNDASLQRRSRCFCSIFYIKLLENMAYVQFHGHLGNIQVGSNLFVT